MCYKTLTDALAEDGGGERIVIEQLRRGEEHVVACVRTR